MSINLDRFSQPLSGEGAPDFDEQEEIEWQKADRYYDQRVDRESIENED